MKRLLSFLRRGIIYWLPMALLMTAALARLAIPEVLDRLSLFAFDVYERAAPRQMPDDPPVLIVDIDEHSLKQLGQWPWPRTIVAEILDKLREAGAAVIAFDVLFSEPDRTSPQMLQALLTSRGATEEDAKRLLATMPDRRVPLTLRLGAAPEPSLAAEALRVGLGARGYVGRYAGAQQEKSFGENTGLNAIEIRVPQANTRVEVPTDRAGQVTLHYARRDPRRYVSAADVLAGNFDAARVADHIVLVGASAAGLNDLKATPIAPDMPGVEIHAQLIEQILQQAFLTRPDWAVGAEIVFALLTGTVMILVLPRIGALLSAVLGAAAVVAAFAMSWFAFKDLQLLIDPVYPWVVLSLVYLVASLLGYLRTEARQRQIRRTFSQYMSPHYVEELARHPERLKLGGQARSMTIMFCDIRGFTSLSERLDTEALTHFMNSFLSPMTEIITEQKGTIDKYIGDCIMAFWNAPLDDPEHVQNAVRAAQAMRRKLAELNREWEAEAAYRVILPVRFGIGINTGECVVGNFGSEAHFDYSLLGDPVNLASRLEGLGKVYGIDLIIGEETAASLDDPTLLELDLVAVKGKTQAGRIFTLPPEQVEGDEFIKEHSALLTAYRRQDWTAALHLLDDSRLAAARHLAPVYELYRQRIARFQTEAPPTNWNGVFTAEEK